jgi:hypothetical protein
MSYFLYFVNIFLFHKILTPIAHNVPAVCDVLPARIRALRRHLCRSIASAGTRPGLQKCAGMRRGNVPQLRWGAQRNDLAIVEAEPPTGPVRPAGQKSANRPVMCSRPRFNDFILTPFV